MSIVSDVTVRNESLFRLTQVALRCRLMGSGLMDTNFLEWAILIPGQPPLNPLDNRQVERRLAKDVFDLRKTGCGARGW